MEPLFRAIWIVWFVAIVAFILSIAGNCYLTSLSKKVDEIEEALDEFSDESLDEMIDIYDECDSKDLQLLEMIDNLLDVQSSNLRCMKALNEKIDNLAKKQEFDAQDLFELYTDFFTEEPEECPKVDTCTKAPCKESCPKRGRPAKK